MSTFRWNRILMVAFLMAAVALAAGFGPARADGPAGGEAATDGAPETANHVGSLAAAAQDDDFVDFNGDGRGDLAIGAPALGNQSSEAGYASVNVLYGQRRGLTAVNDQLWTAGTTGGQEVYGNLFGLALAADDFNGDGYTDLAVGAPATLTGIGTDPGQVHILYGSASGLIATGQVFSQDTPSVEGVGEPGDGFGYALTAGDFNGDGFADLAVGVPYEDYESGGIADMGAVNILYGTWAGLTAAFDLIIHPALDSVSGTPAEDGLFGYSLAAGDYDNDGFDDLAVGIPGYVVGGEDVGAAEVFRGSPGGISLVGEQLWRQGFNGVQGAPEAGDAFGAELNSGDFDANGADDLAIGAPGEDIETNSYDYWDAGAVHILYGYALTDGLTGAGDQLLHRGATGVNGPLNNELFFGGALAAVDFNGDGADDLAVGVLGDSPRFYHQGSVQVFYSTGAVLGLTGQQIWTQGTLVGTPEAEDRMGFALGAGDFNGDGYADLAAGAAYEDVGATQDAGAVNVVHGSARGLTATRNRIWHPQSPGVLGSAIESGHFGWALTR